MSCGGTRGLVLLHLARADCGLWLRLTAKLLCRTVPDAVRRRDDHSQAVVPARHATQGRRIPPDGAGRHAPSCCSALNPESRWRVSWRQRSRLLAYFLTFTRRARPETAVGAALCAVIPRRGAAPAHPRAQELSCKIAARRGPSAQMASTVGLPAKTSFRLKTENTRHLNTGTSSILFWTCRFLNESLFY
jgi:hypothetical protein